MAHATAFTGTVRGGKFYPDDLPGFTRAFSKKDGTRMVVSAKKFVPKRSNDANAFWWACVVPLFQEEMGLDSKEQTHAAVLIELGHCEESAAFGKRRMVPKPTRDLPADEFKALILKAERLYAEYFGGRIPPMESPQAQAMMQGA